MKPVVNMVNALGELVGRLTLPAREKKELEAEIMKLMYEYEREIAEVQANVIQAEATGNWLQRSWRPLVMLTFAVIILVGTFTSLPILADSSRFWDLLEIGLGGYVIGRSGEKMLGAIARKRR
ncbi:3TM-type holin [uncultured Butyricimonas sp.]|uniref:3TM-type holin n=1 Tax=uncultured Butyricimonas sp. TaxID=1268785 RepID=UPI0026DC9986|nr:3TM-type holin [uncultured Butyricimonas sp.]